MSSDSLPGDALSLAELAAGLLTLANIGAANPSARRAACRFRSAAYWHIGNRAFKQGDGKSSIRTDQTAPELLLQSALSEVVNHMSAMSDHGRIDPAATRAVAGELAKFLPATTTAPHILPIGVNDAPLGVWLVPSMSKAEMAKRLKTSVKKIPLMLRRFGLKKDSRQGWTLRLDNMPKNMRDAITLAR